MTVPPRNLAWLAAHHFGAIRVASFALCSGPALWLLGEWLTGGLGVNPLNRLLHFSGCWALAMLLVTLAVTPVRRLSVALSKAVHARYGKRVSDWNWLIRLRRQFGLFTFFYAGLHLALYLAFDVGFNAGSVRDDVLERPFILLGFIAFALLAPLAATSNQAAIKALGRQWQRLHTLTYPIAIVAMAHFWLQMKAGQFAPWPYSLILVLLLAWRVSDKLSGVEVKEREGGAAPAGARAAPGRALDRERPRPGCHPHGGACADVGQHGAAGDMTGDQFGLPPDRFDVAHGLPVVADAFAGPAHRC